MLGGTYLSQEIRIDKLVDHTTAGTGDVSSAGVDMAEDGGYDGVIFMTSYGTAAADNILKAAQSSDDGSSDDYTELDSTAQIASGASPSNEDVVLDIFRPTKRYVKPVPERGTSSTLESVWAIRYRSRNRPVTAPTSGTAGVVRSSSPAEV